MEGDPQARSQGQKEVAGLRTPRPNVSKIRPTRGENTAFGIQYDIDRWCV